MTMIPKLALSAMATYIMSSAPILAFYRGLMGQGVPWWYVGHMSALATGLTIAVVLAFLWYVIKLLAEV